MIKDFPNKQYYCKTLTVPSRIEIDGPCEIEVKSINQFGKVEMVFITKRNAIVDIYKLKKEEIEK